MSLLIECGEANMAAGTQYLILPAFPPVVTKTSTTVSGTFAGLRDLTTGSQQLQAVPFACINAECMVGRG